MSPLFSLAVLSLIQNGWKVEESALVTPPWVVQSAKPIDDESVGVIAERPGARDGGVEFAIFLARGGEAPTLLERFSGSTSEGTGTGTGFTAMVLRENGKQELYRVRLAPPVSLVSLGQFETDPRAVSCDDAVTDCVVAMTDGRALRWRAGAQRPLFQPLADSEAGDFEPWGAAMRPDGGMVALGMGSSTVLMSLDSGKVTVVRGAMTLQRASLPALAVELSQKPGLRERWDRAARACTASPQGWQNGNALVSLAAAGEIGGFCPLKPADFEFELPTLKRKPLPSYPWKVIDCPEGGWTSSVGTLLTRCDDPDVRIGRMLRGPRPRSSDGGAEEPSRELPEAVALSETELFVMEPNPKQPYRWYRGKPKGKGLPFIVDGPSVLRFVQKGVIVEQVTWSFGVALFQHALRDDWHLIEPRGASWALVRFRATP